MKILKLRFKNIHSFKGAHVINFDEPPLSLSGLFAITGSTGAGKSTILDVITLALFNQIPRFDSKITNNAIATLGSVMTHYTDEAYAEVEYKTANEIYRSTWRISKTRNNTLKDYEMFLANSSGVFLDKKKSEIPFENERLIGLNYEQFVRSIILSQGEFAKFLKADKSERTSLLEEITGSKIYRTIGISSYDKAKTKREELQQLKTKKDAIPVLSEEEILNKSLTIEKNKNNITQTEKYLLESNQILTLVQKKNQITQKLAAAKLSIDTLNTRKSNFQEKEKQLHKHRELEPFRSDITLWMYDHHSAIEKQQEIETCQNKITEQETLLNKSILEMAHFTKAIVTEENFLSEMKKFEYRIIQLDGALSTIKEKGAMARKELNEALGNANYATYARPLLDIKLEKEQRQYCDNFLRAADMRKMYDDHDEQLRLKTNSLNEAISKEQIRSDRLDLYTKLRSELEEMEHSILEQKQLYEANSEELKSLQIQINDLVPEMSELQKKKDEQLKVTSLAEHRKLLRDHEPCPLCGATQHPYNTQHIYYDIGETEVLIRLLKDRQDTLNNDYLRITANTASIDATIKSLQNEINKKIKSFNDIADAYPEFITLENIASTSQITLTSLKQEMQGIQNELEIRSAIQFYKHCETRLNTLLESLDQHNTTHELRQSLYTGIDINGDADKLQNQYISARDIIKEKKGILQNLKKSRSELLLSKDKREQALNTSISVLGYPGIQEAMTHILDDEKLKIILTEKETLDTEENHLNTHISALEKEYEAIDLPVDHDYNINDLEDKIHVLQNEKDRMLYENGAISGQLADDVKARAQIAALEKQWENMSKEAQVWFELEKLIGDATGNKYARYAQNLSLKHLLVLANKRLNKLTDRYQMIHTDIESDLMVCDLYQGNTQRSVKTLSGGESFIVSLALALSLADMASKNIRLESLFIDEGFGTLDAETLETAIETLERLQSESNRMIGIISHVESLKERITTQIKVIKSVGGYATIELTG